MKSWYTSKIVLGGILIFLLNALQAFSDWYSKGTYDVPAICALIISLLVIAARIWFTDQVINTPQARAKAEADARDARLNEQELRF